jgi:diguanylate cyclase (GGDEF)-like protein
MESGKTSGQRILELEAQLNSATDQYARIDALNELAWAIHLNDQEKAQGLAEQAYELSSSLEFEKEPYLLGLAGSLRCLAALNNDAGNYDMALTQSMRAIEILEGIPENRPEIISMRLDILGAISWTYRCYGDYVVAADYATKALKLAQTEGDRLHESGMLNVLSVIYAESNDLASALEIGQKVVQDCHELGNVRGESIALNNLAMTYLDIGNGAQALETCRESLRLARENGVDAVAVTALSTMGEVYLEMKDFTKAEEHLSQSLELSRQHKAGPDEFQCLLNLGKVYQFQQKDDAALSAFQSALSLSHVSNDRRGESQCHHLLSEVYEKRREFEPALQHFKQYHALKETVFNENTARRLAGLRVVHQVETAKRDAEIQYLKTIELKKEIEERIKTQASLEKLATLDPLTGLLNRREFFLLGEREVEYALQSKQPLTAILFDLDHFKLTNDDHGHAIGDQVLIHTAKAVRESLRQGEIFGRYGGDEFAILLPGSSCLHGQQVAERLREKMASETITTPKGNLSQTISLGITELRETHSPNLDTLLEFADQALYAAKRAGRNQLAVYSDSSQRKP